MNKYGILFLLVIFILIISCQNNNKTKNDVIYDSITAEISLKTEDSATSKFTDNKPDSVMANQHTESCPTGSKLKADDYIKQYPANQKTELRRHIESLRTAWQYVPNPITATYHGNDFGDYHHILFKDANGVAYDFGQANNSYGKYKLHELSGQYEDNPEFLGKEFNVYWDWKIAEFFCCDGEYGKAKACLPSITKLELVKN